jgi:hypothetical protein
LVSTTASIRKFVPKDSREQALRAPMTPPPGSRPPPDAPHLSANHLQSAYAPCWPFMRRGHRPRKAHGYSAICVFMKDRP